MPMHLLCIALRLCLHSPASLYPHPAEFRGVHLEIRARAGSLLQQRKRVRVTARARVMDS